MTIERIGEIILAHTLAAGKRIVAGEPLGAVAEDEASLAAHEIEAETLADVITHAKAKA